MLFQEPLRIGSSHNRAPKPFMGFGGGNASSVSAAPAPAPASAPAPAPAPASQPGVVHSQFNSPINMYSQDNVQQTYGQTASQLPGQMAG